MIAAPMDGLGPRLAVRLWRQDDVRAALCTQLGGFWLRGDRSRATAWP